MRNLKRVLSLALASVMLMGMMVVGTSAAYADVEATDNVEAIEVLQMVGIMKGDENGNFNPDANVTRNEMAVVMCNLLGLTPGGATNFTDVPAWAQPYVAACYTNGIIAGYDADTFGGSDGVTAAQASLMVMKALGYFGFQGEFGESWKLAVVKQANKIDLYDNINAYTDMTMTRNDVAQLILNALQSTVTIVTEIGGMSVEGNGIVVNQTATYDYDAAQNNSGKDYANNTYGGMGTMQLVEKLFNDNLKKDVTTVADDFGRPATKWTYGDKKVTAPDAPTLTYVGSVTGEKIYVDLGNIVPTTTIIKENNVTVTAGTGSVKANFAIGNGYKADDQKVGGNGTIVEVYYNNDNPGATVATIVIVNTYVDVVTDCKEKANGKYEITLKTCSKKFESAKAYEEDDVVLYTRQDTGSLGTVNKIKSMALAESFTGEVTTVKAADSFVVDGKTYKYAANFDANAIESGYSKLGTTAVDTDVEAYVDANGFVIAFGEVDENTNYAVVLGKSTGTYATDAMAKVLFADGTIESVDVKKSGYGAIVVGGIHTFTVNNNDVYDLTPVGTTFAAGTNTLAIEQGKAAMTINGNAVVANNKTVFFYYDQNDDEYTTYTGIAKVADLATTTVSYSGATYVDGSLKAAFISAATNVAENSADDVIFVYSKGDEKAEKDTDLGNYYTFKTYADGVAGTIKVTGDAYTALQSAGGYLVKGVKADAKGIATSVVLASAGLDSDGDGYIITTLTAEAKDGVIADTAYAEDVNVVKYNTTDKAFETKSISVLEDQAIWAVVAENVITDIYFIGA